MSIVLVVILSYLGISIPFMIFVYPMYIQYSWGSLEMEAVLFVETGDEYKCWYYTDTPGWATTERYNVGYKTLEDGTNHKYVITEWGNLNCMKHMIGISMSELLIIIN